MDKKSCIACVVMFLCSRLILPATQRIRSSCFCLGNSTTLPCALTALNIFERLSTSSSTNTIYVLSGIWQSAGWNSIIYLAALSSVDTQLYDACKIDGANRWQTMIHIDLPVLVPTIVILLIMSMGNILNVGFDKIFLMQQSGNLSASQVISTYVYDVAIKSGQFSFGSAVGLFSNIINFIFLMATNQIAKKLTGTGLM